MSNTLSSCHDLFGRSIQDVFPKSQHCLAISQEFIADSLATLIKLNEFLISKKEALFLFDPTAFNNQCHLYALMVTQKKIDDKFLHLMLFLSYAFLTDTSLLGKIYDKASQEIEFISPKPIKKFKTFLKDPEGERTRASRIALLALFETKLKTDLGSEQGALYKELYLIAQQDLQLPPTSGSGTVYTYPKLAGVAYMINVIAHEQLTVLFKVKIMTAKGTGSFSFCSKPGDSISEEKPILVLEMIGTDDTLTYLQCRDISKKCPTHSRRHIKSADRHKEGESCLFCTSQRIDIGSYREKILPKLKDMDKLFYALGADFVLEQQSAFVKFFSDEISYPYLTNVFQDAVPNIATFGVSMNKPLNFSVSHSYTDCKSYAFKEDLIIDATYEQHLCTRGLI